MSKRMGRNPFDKRAKAQQPEIKPELELEGELLDLPEDHEMPTTPTGLITRILVDLPADAYVLSLKTRMFLRTWLK